MDIYQSQLVRAPSAILTLNVTTSASGIVTILQADECPRWVSFEAVGANVHLVFGSSSNLAVFTATPSTTGASLGIYTGQPRSLFIGAGQRFIKHIGEANATLRYYLS